MDIIHNDFSLLEFIENISFITADQLAEASGVTVEAAEERLQRQVGGCLDVVKPDCGCPSRYYITSQAKSMFFKETESHVRRNKALKDSPARLSEGSDIKDSDIDLLVMLEELGQGVSLRQVAAHTGISLHLLDMKVERLIYYGFLQRIMPSHRIIHYIYKLYYIEFNGGMYYLG